MRHVLSECGAPNGTINEMLAFAQAAELYFGRQCSSSCLYHPTSPTLAGWSYDAVGRCFAPWQGNGNACAKSLTERPAELADLVGRASRGCALHLRCTPPVPVSSSALQASGCPSRHKHRNASSLCGSGLLSIDVARAQVDRLWDGCGARCLYSPITPAAAGWVYEASQSCFKPFQLKAADAPWSASAGESTSQCLGARREAAARRVIGRASQLCSECGEPQLREPCYDAVIRELAAQGSRPFSSSSASSSASDGFDSVQARLAAAGRCRMPCLRNVPVPSPHSTNVV